MVNPNANTVPTESKLIIFHQFISFEGFTASWETTIQITTETIDIMAINSLDTFNPPLNPYVPQFLALIIKKCGVVISL